MTITDIEYKDLILAELGDTSDGRLAANIDLLWSRFDALSGDTRYLYTKRAAIDLLLAAAYNQVDFRTSSGSAVSLDQITKHLQNLREQVVAEIVTASTTGVGSGMAIGELETTAPIMRDRTGQPDPGARGLRGDPLKRWPC